MIKLKNLFTEIISNTDFGQDIYYIFESKSGVENQVDRLGSHIIKILMKSPSIYDSSWENSVKNSLYEIYRKNRWFRNKSKKYQKEYISNLLDFDDFYRTAKNSFNLELKNNEIPFPDKNPEGLRGKFQKVWINILDDFEINGFERWETYSINKIIGLSKKV